MINRVAVAVAVGLLVFLASHIVLWRAAPSNSPRIVRLGFLGMVGVVVSIVTTIYFFDSEAPPLAVVLWFDVSAVIAYVFVYAGLARSVSVTLLGRLSEARHRPIALDALAREYARSARFDDRLELMHQSGLIEVSGDLVRLTAKGRRLAQATQVISRAIGTRMEG